MGFARVEQALREVADRIVANENRMANAKSTVAEAAADLASMATAYTVILAEINSIADADASMAHLKGRKDKLVSEFGVLKTKADAMKAALAGF